MTQVFSSFLRAVGQFDDPVFRRIIATSIATALGVLWGIALILSWGISLLLSDGITLPIIGTLFQDPLPIGWSSFFISIALSMFLMVPVASAISSLFLDRVASAVEARHYPNLPPAPSQGLRAALQDTFGFLGILIAANLIALILYIFLPIFAPFIFWGLNGYLLAREYFQMAASRRTGRDGARILWKRHKLVLWLAGICMVAPLSIPILNLVVPVLGAATFTHLYHSFPAVPSDYRNQYRAP